MTFDEIIAAMERGETGRELDARIAVALGHEVVTIELPKGHPAFKEGGSEFMAGPNGNRCEVPPYTTSLDAKIPGEDIIKMELLELQPLGYPFGWYYTAQDKNASYEAIGPTEIAARRAAGLRAWKERT